MGKAVKHELYKVTVDFTVWLPALKEGEKAETTRRHGGSLLIMSREDNILHVADILSDEFLGKPEPGKYFGKSGTVEKVHVVDLRRLNFQPSLGVIVEE